MATIARGSKASGGTTFLDGTTAYGSEVETDFNTIYTAWNNTDAGTTKWTVVSALGSSSVPLVADNSTGSQDVAQFKVNGTTQWNVTGTGNLNSNAKKITGLAAGTANGDSLRYEQLVPSLTAYRRPVLQYNSGTVVNVETSLDGTSGDCTILFPDGTKRTDTATGRIQCNLAQVAALSGSWQSGLRTGSVANNTWYAIYAVKTTDDTAKIVMVADTVLPLQANFATLNSNFGTNGWVYLGLLRNGDNSGTVTGILQFNQTGNLTTFVNGCIGNVLNSTGIRLAIASSASSAAWAYASGTGAAQVPANVINALVGGTCSQGGALAAWRIESNSGGTAAGRLFTGITGVSAVSQGAFNIVSPITGGLFVGVSTNSASFDVYLNGFFDNVLGVGANPLL